MSDSISHVGEPGDIVASPGETDPAIPVEVREAVTELRETLNRPLPGTPEGTRARLPRVSHIPVPPILATPPQPIPQPQFTGLSPPTWAAATPAGLETLLRDELQVPQSVRLAFNRLGYLDIRTIVEISRLDANELVTLQPRTDFTVPELGDALLLVHCLGEVFADVLSVPGISDTTLAALTRFPEDEQGTNDFLLRLRSSSLQRTYRKAHRDFRGALADACELRVRDPLVGSVVQTNSSGISSNDSEWSNFSDSHKSRYSRSSRHSTRSHRSRRTKRYQPKGNDYAFTGTPTPAHLANLPGTDITANADNLTTNIEDKSVPSSVDDSYNTAQRASNGFMKGLDPRLRKTEKDDKRSVLPARYEWLGAIEDFEAFQNKVEGHYGQCGAGYLFDPAFQEAYVRDGPSCYVEFLEDVASASQIKKDVRVLYGALKSACHVGVGRTILDGPSSLSTARNKTACAHGWNW